MTMVGQPHVLVFPYPAQGHVMPLMKFSYCLVDQGCKITFVTTEFIHDMLSNPLQEKGNEIDGISLVSVPDGLTPDERNDPDKLTIALRDNIPSELEKLIRTLNETGPNGKIVCVVADDVVARVLDVARKMGIRQASFFPAAATLKATIIHISKLIEIGAIDESGTSNTNDAIIWVPTMPDVKASCLPWNCLHGLFSCEDVFRDTIENSYSSKNAEWAFCNTFEKLEQEAITLIPNSLPVGPLLVNNQLGSFWEEDLTCLSWLDKQAANSVIYVAFGSITILDQRQISELALSLELLRRPFLWVIRTGTDVYGRPTTTYPDGFEERVAKFGKMVSWAPQQKVLSHLSIACFVSHCGWNSIIDGVTMGVPFICRPYFADQYFNEICITDVWKIGLGLNADEDGIISRDEIIRKLDQLLEDKKIKENSQKLKELAMKSVENEGSPLKNLELFVEELRN